MTDVDRLSGDEQRLTVTLLQALDTGWLLVDEEDRFDYVLLFDESRTEMEDFKPSKVFIQKVESMGLILDRDATFGSRPREIGVHYESWEPKWKVRAVETPLPIVYFYSVTTLGRSFLGHRGLS